MNTREIIRDFITTEMLHQPLETPLRDDAPLVESGIIDSMGVMTLLSFLENTFSIQVSGEDLMPENFSSIETIATLVERYIR
ncbi:MAG: acyl carrier protein [Anaerolineales bacterium]|nr:acyl carrier protein [Anaerolineales bacterium]MCX7753861.1 acyl carrier protein [Anaerolineales bacterium]MDW8279171.1 acyl carrier protein [Anaerolineales bacterium]